MPEIANESFCSRSLAAFPARNPKNINNLILISFRRVRAWCQSISWIISLLFSDLQRETARLSPVISLFRFRNVEEFCGLRSFSRCIFAGINSENSGLHPMGETEK